MCSFEEWTSPWHLALKGQTTKQRLLQTDCQRRPLCYIRCLHSPFNSGVCVYMYICTCLNCAVIHPRCSLVWNSNLFVLAGMLHLPCSPERNYHIYQGASHGISRDTPEPQLRLQRNDHCKSNPVSAVMQAQSWFSGRTWYDREGYSVGFDSKS